MVNWVIQQPSINYPWTLHVRKSVIKNEAELAKSLRPPKLRGVLNLRVLMFLGDRVLFDFQPDPFEKDWYATLEKSLIEEFGEQGTWA